MLYLKEANYEDIEKEYLFVKDMPVDENGLTNPWHGISREEFEIAALPTMIAYSKGEQLPEGLRLTLEVARTIIPEDEIYLRVNRDNPASLKVMLHNGGYICKEDDSKYYVRIQK